MIVTKWEKLTLTENYIIILQDLLQKFMENCQRCKKKNTTNNINIYGNKENNKENVNIAIE